MLVSEGVCFGFLLVKDLYKTPFATWHPEWGECVSNFAKCMGNSYCGRFFFQVGQRHA